MTWKSEAIRKKEIKCSAETDEVNVNEDKEAEVASYTTLPNILSIFSLFDNQRRRLRSQKRAKYAIH